MLPGGLLISGLTKNAYERRLDSVSWAKRNFSKRHGYDNAFFVESIVRLDFTLICAIM